MTQDQFFEVLRKSVRPGHEFVNPGGGTSRVLSIRRGGVSYQRGKSTIVLSIGDAYDAYEHFKGQRVSSAELRSINPSVFDSAARPAGHSCNCTFLFSMLQAAGLARSFQGSGVRGKPYSVEVVA